MPTTLEEQKVLLYLLKLARNPDNTLSIPCNFNELDGIVVRLISKLEASINQLEVYKHEMDVKLI